MLREPRHNRPINPNRNISLKNASTRLVERVLSKLQNFDHQWWFRWLKAVG